MFDEKIRRFKNGSFNKSQQSRKTKMDFHMLLKKLRNERLLQRYATHVP